MNSENEGEIPDQCYQGDCRRRARQAARAALSELSACADNLPPRSACPDVSEWLRIESQSLCAWAQENGWLLDWDSFKQFIQDGTPLPHGNEHEVYFLEGVGRVLKITKPPNFGARGTAASYLKNHLWCNALFEDDIRLVGVLPTDSGISLVVSQDFIFGDAPTREEISDWFIQQGYVNIQRGIWEHPKSQVRIADAHTGNLIRIVTGELIPIDLLVLSPGKDH